MARALGAHRRRVLGRLTRWTWITWSLGAAIALMGLYSSNWVQWPRIVGVPLLVLAAALSDRRDQAVVEQLGRDQEAERASAAEDVAEGLVAAFRQLRPVAEALKDAGGSTQAERRDGARDLRSAALEAAKELMKGPDGRVVLFRLEESETDGSLWFVPAKSRGRPGDSTLRIPTSDYDPESMLGKMLETGEPQVYPDINELAPPGFHDRPHGPYQSFASAPIRTSDGALYGLLAIDHTEPKAVDTNDGQVLAVIALLLAAGLARDPDAKHWVPAIHRP